MTPHLTKDDWFILVVSIILVAVLPGWIVLLLPFLPIAFAVLIGTLLFRR